MEANVQETSRDQLVSESAPISCISPSSVPLQTTVSSESNTVICQTDIAKPPQSTDEGPVDNTEDEQIREFSGKNDLDKMSGELSDHLGQLNTHEPPPVVSSVSSRRSTYEIEADMMQIDLILKALNSGTFDQGNMLTIDHLTSKKPQNVVSAVQIAPSTGLSLIGQMYSDNEDSSSSSDSEASSGEESIGEERKDQNEACDSDDSASNQKKPEKRKYGYPMVKGEVDYRDLPPDDVDALECPNNMALTSVGTVKSTTEKLIIIESLPGVCPLDEGTVVWSSQRQAIGKLFETFGPVKKPFYSIRANTLSVLAGDTVFAVLDNADFTKFAFMSNILDQKGSDASWQNDEEIPEEHQEYSDDEKERLASKEKSHKRTSHPQAGCSSNENRIASARRCRPSRPNYTRPKLSFGPQYLLPPSYPPTPQPLPCPPPFPPPPPPPHILPTPPPVFPATPPFPPYQYYPDVPIPPFNDFAFPNTPYPPPFNANYCDGHSSANSYDRTMWRNF